MVEALYFPVAHQSNISNKHSQSNFYSPVIHHLQSLRIVLYMIHTYYQVFVRICISPRTNYVYIIEFLRGQHLINKLTVIYLLINNKVKRDIANDLIAIKF